jgi:HD-GYP domain-containing protein (c-di-GMP phosphodiesterase class II)
MISERPYRKSFSNKEVLDVIKQESEIKWDPAIVNTLYEIKINT